MRALVAGALVAGVMLGLGWLLGPRTPAPPLPPELVGDASWLVRAERLSQYRRVLGLVRLAFTPLGLWLFIRLGWSAALRDWLTTEGIANAWLLVGAFTMILMTAATLLTLPFGYIDLVLRRAYDLSHESTTAWLIRQGKALGVSLVITLIVVQGLYWLLRTLPHWWWAPAAFGGVVFTIALTYLQPYVITPLFFTQRPLADESLRAAIITLGERSGVPINEVYVIDASRQGNEGNAYFTGVGGATRVVLYDTLLRDYQRDELLTILAHELGHWRYHHIWQGIALTAVGAPVGLWLVHLLLQRLLPAWGIRDPADIASLPLILLIVTLGSYLLLPAENALSRHWERQADRFAIAATGNPQAFQRTFVRLARQNLADPTPPRLIEGLFGTHPAIGRRVADAQQMLDP